MEKEKITVNKRILLLKRELEITCRSLETTHKKINSLIKQKQLIEKLIKKKQRGFSSTNTDIFTEIPFLKSKFPVSKSQQEIINIIFSTRKTGLKFKEIYRLYIERGGKRNKKSLNISINDWCKQKNSPIKKERYAFYSVDLG